MPTVATIGVYGFTADTVLAALRRAKVQVVLDVRQRRGVRGAEYSWANAVRLQAALADAGIEYRHLRELGGFEAPGPLAPADLVARVGAGGYRLTAYACEAEQFR